MEKERRFIPAGAEVRVTDDGGKKGIRGMAALTNSLSRDLGGFVERIAPGAFDEALERSDVRALFNHDPNMILGRSGATLTLRATDEGLEYEIPDLPKSRADVLEAIERGDVTGNSFAFTVAEDGDTWEKQDDQVVRTITRFAELFDVGPVTYPAYPETTVSARSLERVSELLSDDEPDARERNRLAWAEKKQRSAVARLDT